METTIEEKMLYQGKMLEIVEKKIGNKLFEIARRSPWVRLLFLKGNHILLTRERRHEYNAYDYRLPWWKVFDTLSEYNEKLANNEDIFLYAQQSANKEAKEEAGLLPTTLRHLTTSKAGATVEWDLYYFVVEDFTENQKGQELEEWEDIAIERKTRDEVKQLCLAGDIREERTVGVLLKFLLQV